MREIRARRAFQPSTVWEHGVGAGQRLPSGTELADDEAPARPASRWDALPVTAAAPWRPGVRHLETSRTQSKQQS